MLPGYAMSTGDQGLFNRPGYNTAVVGLSGPTGAFSANGTGATGIATVTDGVSLTDIATNSGSVQTDQHRHGAGGEGHQFVLRRGSTPRGRR